MKTFICVCFAFIFTFCAYAQNLSEGQKIDKLIAHISNIQGAKFIRNGDEHDAKKAADHLQMKRKNAGNRIKTARDFIDKIATKSSMSGDYYMIIFPNGSKKRACDVLNEELKRLENR